MADSFLLHWDPNGQAWLSIWGGGKLLHQINVPLPELKAQAAQFNRAVQEIKENAESREGQSDG